VRVLLDTCVLADLRKPGGHPAVKAAVALIADDDLYISGLTLGEVARGVSLLPDGRKKRNLHAWLTGLQDRFPDRILGVDHETAQLWGEIAARTQRTGHLLDMVDGLLAATALCRGLHIMTRITSSLAATGVLIVDPYTDSLTSQNS
jgi:predicted nucleic acid-binding protein